MKKSVGAVSGVFVGLTMTGLSAGGAAAPQSAPQAPARELPPLQLVQRIRVPDVSGRIDHFTVYPKKLGC